MKKFVFVFCLVCCSALCFGEHSLPFEWDYMPPVMIDKYRALADQGDAEGMYLYSYALRNIQSNIEYWGVKVRNERWLPLGYLEKSADTGFGPACYALGVVFQFGVPGVASNAVVAAEWYKKALAWAKDDLRNEDAWAQYILGRCYEWGAGGVEKNGIEAMKWYRKAAEHGLADAQCQLGEAFALGRFGCEKDDAEAVKWYSKAGEQGSPYAYHMVNCRISYKISRGVEWMRKYKVRHLELEEYAYKYFMNHRNDFEEGDLNDNCPVEVDAEKIAKLMVEDPFKAVELLKKSYSGKAKIYLGRCYMKGVGVEKDCMRGLQLRFEAAGNGYGHEYLELAKETESRESQRLYYRLAMDAGIEEGKRLLMYNIGNELENNEGKYKEMPVGRLGGYLYITEQDINGWKELSSEFCYKYFSDVANSSNESAYDMEFLGYCFYMMGVYTENGWACTKDNTMALQWYNRARAKGNYLGKRAFSRLEKKYSRETVAAIINKVDHDCRAEAVKARGKFDGLFGRKFGEFVCDITAAEYIYVRDWETAFWRMKFEPGKKSTAFQDYYLWMTLATHKVFAVEARSNKWMPDGFLELLEKKYQLMFTADRDIAEMVFPDEKCSLKVFGATSDADLVGAAMVTSLFAGAIFGDRGVEDTLGAYNEEIEKKKRQRKCYQFGKGGDDFKSLVVAEDVTLSALAKKEAEELWERRRKAEEQKKKQEAEDAASAF